MQSARNSGRTFPETALPVRFLLENRERMHLKQRATVAAHFS